GFVLREDYRGVPGEFRFGAGKKSSPPAGVAADPAGRELYVAGSMGDAICVCSLSEPAKHHFIKVEQQSYPYACLRDAANNRLFVSLWGKGALVVIDLKTRQAVANWPTESHPTEMVLSPNGGTLFVASANSSKVVALDTSTGKMVEAFSAALYPDGPAGNTPNSLCLGPEGKVLFVANADANNIAVFNVSQLGRTTPLGFIPVGWYP